MGKNQTNKHRYRIKDFVAKELGLELNKSCRYRLSNSQEAEFLSKYKHIKAKRLYFDIETSPNIVYSWRIGWNLTIAPHNIIDERKVICICWKWEDDDKVHYSTWDKNQCDKKALEKSLQPCH